MGHHLRVCDYIQQVVNYYLMAEYSTSHSYYTSSVVKNNKNFLVFLKSLLLFLKFLFNKELF
jgi:hypothetical protein